MQLFLLPTSEILEHSEEHRELAQKLVNAWRQDGAFYIAVDECRAQGLANAFDASRRFMELPYGLKKTHVNALAYSGYFNGGDEYEVEQNKETAFVKEEDKQKQQNTENWESFAVSQDVPLDDDRVQTKWPCHGPVPWQDEHQRNTILPFMRDLGQLGQTLLKLIAMGLGMGVDVLNNLCHQGFHRLQCVHYPSADENTFNEQIIGGEDKKRRSLSAHTDNGLLIILAQDVTGGLFIRPPVEGEPRARNWLDSESTSGQFEHVAPWNFVPPLPGTLVCFPGDMFQLVTNNYILATPHKVLTGTQERYSFAYFHEPNFNRMVGPLVEENAENMGAMEQPIFYGEFFTKLFMTTYPSRITTKALLEQPERMAKLGELKKKAMENEK